MREGNNTAVPVGARLEDRTAAMLPDGQVVRVELYRGQASDGYQTGYAARPAAWLAFIRKDGNGGRVNYRVVKRYSGRNLERAAHDYAEAASEFAAAIGRGEVS